MAEKIINHSDKPPIRKVTRHIHCNDNARALAPKRLPRIIIDFVDGATGEPGQSSLVANMTNEISLTLDQIGLRKVEDIDAKPMYQHPPTLL